MPIERTATRRTPTANTTSPKPRVTQHATSDRPAAALQRMDAPTRPKSASGHRPLPPVFAAQPRRAASTKQAAKSPTPVDGELRAAFDDQVLARVATISQGVYAGYRGQIRNGIPHGHGNISYSPRHVLAMDGGSCAQGIFKDGQLVRGRITSNKDTSFFYKGSCQSTGYHGKGELHFSNGTTLIGEFRNGRFVRGCCVAPDGFAVHQGEFAEIDGVTVAHGYGTGYERNGEAYTGTFEKNQRVGPFLYHYTNSSWFRHGDATSVENTYRLTDKTTYVGAFLDSHPHGFGKITYPDQTFYEGHHHKGRKQGKGTRVFDRGTQHYVGMFDDNRFHGPGVLTQWVRPKSKTNTDPVEIVYEGTWDRGLKHGKFKYSKDGVTRQHTYDQNVRVHKFLDFFKPSQRPAAAPARRVN